MRRRAALVIGAVALGSALAVGTLAEPIRRLVEPDSLLDEIVGWPGPVRAGLELAPERFAAATDTDPFTARWWEEPQPEALPLSVNIVRVGLQMPTGHLDRLVIELQDAPPLQDGRVYAYGVTIDADGDGIADWVLQMDNDGVNAGEHRATLTNVTTGETEQQLGPPYGQPFDSQWPSRAGNEVTAIVTLDVVRELDPGAVQFYAWAAVSDGGLVLAWDYAPDSGWIAAGRRAEN